MKKTPPSPTSKFIFIVYILSVLFTWRHYGTFYSFVVIIIGFFVGPLLLRFFDEKEWKSLHNEPKAHAPNFRLGGTIALPALLNEAIQFINKTKVNLENCIDTDPLFKYPNGQGYAGMVFTKIKNYRALIANNYTEILEDENINYDPRKLIDVLNELESLLEKKIGI